MKRFIGKWPKQIKTFKCNCCGSLFESDEYSYDKSEKRFYDECVVCDSEDVETHIIV